MRSSPFPFDTFPILLPLTFDPDAMVHFQGPANVGRKGCNYIACESFRTNVLFEVSPWKRRQIPGHSGRRQQCRSSESMDTAQV